MDRKIVDAEFSKIASTAQRVTGKRVVLFHGPVASRRKEALYRYGQQYGERFVNADLMGMTDYDDVNQDLDLTLGAAIWILETMQRTDRFFNMLQILPDLTGDPDADYVPFEFVHPCYSNELINSMMYVILHRHEAKDIVSDEVGMGAEPSNTFKAIISLLPGKEVERACEIFKEKQKDIIRRYLECERYLEKESDRRMADVQAGITNVKNPPKGYAAGPFVNQSIDRDKALRSAIEGEELVELKTHLPRKFEDYLVMERRQIIRETGYRGIADAVKGFAIEDPLAICFAVFYMLENGDDAVWLLTFGVYLSNAAKWRLPWFVDMEAMDEDEWDEWFDGITYKVNDWIEDEPKDELDWNGKHKGRTLSQIVYDLTRCVVPTGKHPFEKDRVRLIEEGMEENVARKVIDTAELLFLREFQAQPYKPFNWDADLFPDEEKSAQEESTDDRTEDVAPRGHWGQMFGTSQSVEEEGEEESFEQASTEQVNKQLEKARKEIKVLRDILYTERRAASDEHAKLERELKSLRMEHRELADLRSLVFNRENADQERVEKVERQISYPYQTRKRTVVFGGHDSFLRVFKPMFPDVRFVDASNMTYSPEIIRNADVVWIQNNCISHPQYWSIVKNCKLAGVQMRYFGYASAEKCAEQLVMEDAK